MAQTRQVRQHQPNSSSCLAGEYFRVQTWSSTPPFRAAIFACKTHFQWAPCGRGTAARQQGTYSGGCSGGLVHCGQTLKSPQVAAPVPTQPAQPKPLPAQQPHAAQQPKPSESFGNFADFDSAAFDSMPAGNFILTSGSGEAYLHI